MREKWKLGEEAPWGLREMCGSKEISVHWGLNSFCDGQAVIHAGVGTTEGEKDKSH